MASIDGVLNGLLRVAIPVGAIALGVLAVVAVLDRMALDQRAAERRALLQRNADLSAGALAPGSALACLDGAAGEAIQQACERTVFASAQSAAAAVAYTGAQLSLLADAADFARRGEPEFLDTFSAARRAVELDRFGLAAQVLAVRDGCTVEACAAFALVRDSGVLKANLRSGVFAQYVARHAEAWNRPAASPPVAERPAEAPVANLADPVPAADRPVRNNLPKTVIPPVSIMDTEPPLPKEAAAANASASAGESPAEVAMPLPPRRPQPPAAAPPAR